MPGSVGPEVNTPEYLINIENTHALIGPLPEVAPPVLADWTEVDPADGWW